MRKILIMGLPGSGKTTLADKLVEKLIDFEYTVTRINADVVRKEANDWDFSYEGRIRQAARMTKLANSVTTDFAIVDFVAPVQEVRNMFAADHVIWMDTITEGRYDDTNKLFEAPTEYAFHIIEKNAEIWAGIIAIFLRAIDKR